MTDFMTAALIFLTSAVVAVPISKKLGLGSVLGYLISGVVIGPWGFRLITDVETILKFSEFGVVLLLFLIGLELEPKKLWSMRVPIFGMGGAQVVFNTLALFAVLLMIVDDWRTAFIAAMGFSLSSTAIALQIIRERNWLLTTGGNSAFSILLFQDIAVIPMLAFLPLLSLRANETSSEPGWWGVFKIVGVLIFFGIVGRYLIRPIMRVIASVHLREVFTAFALLLVFAIAALMHKLEISMALGAFVAGVLLANSEYRHALETDIEPFKGLLLGLFFISVGMSIDFESLKDHPTEIALVVCVLLAVKAFVHFSIGRLFRLPKQQIPFFSLVITQVGEFAFVLFGAAQAAGAMSKEQAGPLVAAAAVSMLTTPLMVPIHDWITRKTKKKPEADKIEDEGSPVIIAGFGRYGQIIGRLLFANKVKATVLDHEPDQIELLRRFGFKIYYGDATRLDLLEAAGAAHAKLLIVAIDSVEDNLKVVDLAKQHFPHLRIMARARNVQHMYSLMDRQIDRIERETFESSLRMGIEVLKSLGWTAYQAVRASQKFREHNYQIIEETHPKRKDEAFVLSRAKQARDDLTKMFEEENIVRERKDLGWD